MKKGGAKQEKQKNTPNKFPHRLRQETVTGQVSLQLTFEKTPLNMWVLSPLSITEMAKARGSVFVT